MVFLFYHSVYNVYVSCRIPITYSNCQLSVIVQKWIIASFCCVGALLCTRVSFLQCFIEVDRFHKIDLDPFLSHASLGTPVLERRLNSRAKSRSRILCWILKMSKLRTWYLHRFLGQNSLVDWTPQPTRFRCLKVALLSGAPFTAFTTVWRPLAMAFTAAPSFRQLVNAPPQSV